MISESVQKAYEGRFSMLSVPVAAVEVRRQMEESLDLRQPPARRRRAARRPVRVASAVALRRLADRLEPATDPC
jgi:hypothetical protein